MLLLVLLPSVVVGTIVEHGAIILSVVVGAIVGTIVEHGDVLECCHWCSYEMLLALLLSMARSYYSLGMLSKVAGKGKVARVGSKVKSDGHV
jgi:hypothetical protein